MARKPIVLGMRKKPNQPACVSAAANAVVVRKHETTDITMRAGEGKWAAIVEGLGGIGELYASFIMKGKRGTCGNTEQHWSLGTY